MLTKSEILSASILIVDDQAVNIALLGQMLADAGYTGVSSTQNPLEVCALHRKNNYDLILLDLKMPLLDGIGVLREIKSSETLRTIPVVVLTSSTEPSDLQRAYDAGTNAYIAKPTEFAQFLAAMKHVCEFWININQPAPQSSAGLSRPTTFGELN